MSDRQPNLFEMGTPDMRPTVFSPKSHANDPATSHEAAKRHQASGNHATNIEIVLALVKRHPLKTACELFKLATADEQYRLGDFYEVRRRLCDLSDPPEPLVRKGTARVCLEKGTRMVTWEAISHG